MHTLIKEYKLTGGVGVCMFGNLHDISAAFFMKTLQNIGYRSHTAFLHRLPAEL
jgi:hypothetical protein